MFAVSRTSSAGTRPETACLALAAAVCRPVAKGERRASVSRDGFLVTAAGFISPLDDFVYLLNPPPAFQLLLLVLDRLYFVMPLASASENATR